MNSMAPEEEYIQQTKTRQEATQYTLNDEQEAQLNIALSNLEESVRKNIEARRKLTNTLERSYEAHSSLISTLERSVDSEVNEGLESRSESEDIFKPESGIETEDIYNNKKYTQIWQWIYNKIFLF